MNHGLRSALVLTGGRSDLVLTACQLLAARGLAVSVAGTASTIRLLRLSRSCGAVTTVADGREELEAGGAPVLERTSAAARACAADLVFPADVPGAVLAGRLRPLLPGARFFPFPEEAALRRLDDKWAFYGLLSELGLPTPRTWRVESRDQALSLPLPLMLKPLASEGGRGVALVRDRAALERRWDEAGPAAACLAQEYVDGEDVDLSFLAHEGRLVSWCVQTRRPDRTMDFIEDERVVDLGRRVAAATRYNGLAHLDMRYTDAARSGVKVIECNPRLWLSAPRALGLGVDFLGRGLALAGGRVPATFEGAATGACADLPAILRRRALGGALTECEKAFWAFAKSDPLPILIRRVQAYVTGVGGGLA